MPTRVDEIADGIFRISTSVAIPDIARSLHPGLQRFDQWLARNAQRIPLE